MNSMASSRPLRVPCPSDLLQPRRAVTTVCNVEATMNDRLITADEFRYLAWRARTPGIAGGDEGNDPLAVVTQKLNDVSARAEAAVAALESGQASTEQIAEFKALLE